MDIKVHFDHYNINVSDLEKSLEFYQNALGLTAVDRYDPADRSFVLLYLGDGVTPFRLELTWMRNHPQPYDLGENETHLAFRINASESYDELHRIHQEMGVICFENPAMGIYFIEDPDGYWIEILPERK